MEKMVLRVAGDVCEQSHPRVSKIVSDSNQTWPVLLTVSQFSAFCPAELIQPPAPPFVPRDVQPRKLWGWESAGSSVCCGQSSWALPCSPVSWCQFWLWEGSAQRQGCPAPVFHGLPSLTEDWALAIYTCSSQRESYSSKIIKCRDQAFHGSLSNLLDGRGSEKPHFPTVNNEIITS